MVGVRNEDTVLLRALRAAAAGWLLAALLLAGCGGSSAKKTPTPLAGELLSGRNSVHSDTCPPDANPLSLVLPALVRITTPPDAAGSYSSGTGIIIDTGWVLTNQHVIDSAASSFVNTFYVDGHKSPGKVIASDPDLDLALVQTDTGTLPSATWGDEGKLENGSVLYAVGYSGGAPVPFEEQGRYIQTTVDRGTGQAYIVSDVQLQHGDSGGPLLNRCGQVIGINTARIPNGIGGSENAGLSIPGFGARRWAMKNRSGQ
ncbi:MAG TPA: serine protease [Dehalococcoidia bacterium]|nr:serine protease [Dehalococcoidia bacterium]